MPHCQANLTHTCTHATPPPPQHMCTHHFSTATETRFSESPPPNLQVMVVMSSVLVVAFVALLQLSNAHRAPLWLPLLAALWFILFVLTVLLHSEMPLPQLSPSMQRLFPDSHHQVQGGRGQGGGDSPHQVQGGRGSGGVRGREVTRCAGGRGWIFLVSWCGVGEGGGGI